MKHSERYKINKNIIHFFVFTVCRRDQLLQRMSNGRTNQITFPTQTF